MDNQEDPSMPNPISKDLEKLVGSSKKKEPKVVPIYKMIGDDKIPASKSLGELWKSRRNIGVKYIESGNRAANEAIRYYKNDQLGHRKDNAGSTNNNSSSSRINSRESETENIVFANATTLLPILYAKNPAVEITAPDTYKKLATVCEHLLNALMQGRIAPCVNLKSKARRAILSCELTNRGWLYLGYTKKEDSSEGALIELNKISDALANAKDQKEIIELEGQLQALEKKIDALTPSGPSVRVLNYDQVIVDPASEDPNHTDARWIMHYGYEPTEYLNAEFGEKAEDGSIRSIYEPTHIMNAGSASTDETVNNFSILDGGSKAAEHGYCDEVAFRNAGHTKVWYIWDATTRRMMMFADNNWAWPIWIWNDPLKLQEFFPYYNLEFVPDPNGGVAKGEVVYILDQQDAINEINSEEKRARRWAFRNMFYDSNRMTREDAESVLKGDDGTARGIKVPEGMTIKDLIFSIAPPSLNFTELFNKDRKYAAIDKITSVKAAMSGGQFKTNTTNDAVQTYNDAASIRIEEKVDQIEDWIGALGWGMLQLCIRNMDEQTVTKLIGPEEGKLWGQATTDPQQLIDLINLTIVGGSTSKPTSKAKKQEAIQMGQVLGQFAGANPMVVEIMLEVFQQAFDEIEMTDDKWSRIREAMSMQLQQGQTNPQQGQPPQEGGQGDQPIPPEAKAAIEAAVAKGVPEEVAVKQVMEQLSNQPTQG